MLKELLGKDREILFMTSAETLYYLDRFACHDDDALLIFYSLEDKEYSTTACKVFDILKESIGSEEYGHRQYTTLKLSKDEEVKLLTLIDIGMDIREIIVSFIKEENIEWLNYKEHYYGQ